MKITYSKLFWGWAVYSPTGNLMHHTVSYLRRDAISKLLEDYNATYTWERMRKRGFHVEKIKVNPL